MCFDEGTNGWRPCSLRSARSSSSSLKTWQATAYWVEQHAGTRIVSLSPDAAPSGDQQQRAGAYFSYDLRHGGAATGTSHLTGQSVQLLAAESEKMLRVLLQTFWQGTQPLCAGQLPA